MVRTKAACHFATLGVQQLGVEVLALAVLLRNGCTASNAYVHLGELHRGIRAGAFGTEKKYFRSHCSS